MDIIGRTLNRVRPNSKPNDSRSRPIVDKSSSKGKKVMVESNVSEEEIQQEMQKILHTPVIITELASVEITGTALYALRQRGFVIELIKERFVLLTVCPLLLESIMCSLYGYDAEYEKLSEFKKLCIANEAVSIVYRTSQASEQSGSKALFSDAWVVHNTIQYEKITEEIQKNTMPWINLQDVMRDDDSITKNHVGRIFEYFGPQIAYYFGWLDFYTTMLVIPAVIGTLVYAYPYINRLLSTVNLAKLSSTEDYDNRLAVYAIFIVLWATTFLEMWKRRSHTLAYWWQVLGVEDGEADRDIANASKSELDDRFMRLCASVGATVTLIMGMIRVMLHYIDMHHRFQEQYTGFLVRLYPSIMYSVLPMILPFMFEPVLQFFHKLESCPTRAGSERSMVYKKFALHFVNTYCALLYVAFYRQDLEHLRALLMSQLTVGALINNLLEVGQPYIAFYKEKFFGKEKVIDLPSTHSHTHHLDCTTLHPGVAKYIVESEELYQPYDLDEDYLEMVMQFGFVTMFAVVFPLSPVLAMVNNCFESRVDLEKLSSCRRSHFAMRSSIGAWQTCLEFVSFAAIFTNCFLIYQSGNVGMFVPVRFTELLESNHFRLMVMVIVEHLLVGFKLLFMAAYDDIPPKIQEGLAALRLAQSAKLKAMNRKMKLGAVVERENKTKSSTNLVRKTTGNVVNAAKSAVGASVSAVGSVGSSVSKVMGSTASATSSLAGKALNSIGLNRSESRSSIYSASHSASSSEKLVPETSQVEMKEEFASPPMTPKTTTSIDEEVEEEVIIEEPEEEPIDKPLQVGVEYLKNQINSPFGFDPISMMTLVATPWLLSQGLSLSPYFYLPAAALYLTYYQAKKDRIDRKTAIGIVSDPKLLALVNKEMPLAVSDPQFERMEWFNTLLSQMWAPLAKGIEPIILPIINEQLKINKPSILTELKMLSCSMGTIAPKIVGMRVVPNAQDNSKMTIDVDFRWAGNPYVELKMATGVPVTVQVSNISVSAVLRAELAGICAKMPFVGGIYITLMQPPFFDFSLKVANLDIMNIGGGDLNFSALLRTTVNTVLSTMLIYPKKYFVPVDEMYQESQAVGIGEMQVKVLSAKNLVTSNIALGTSPVWIKISHAGHSITLKKVNRQNGVYTWDVKKSMDIYDLNQPLEVTVVADSALSKSIVGRAYVRLSELAENQEIPLDLELQRGGSSKEKRGTVKISIQLNLKPRPEDLENKNLTKLKIDRALAEAMSKADSDDILFHLPELTNDLVLQYGGGTDTVFRTATNADGGISVEKETDTVRKAGSEQIKMALRRKSTANVAQVGVLEIRDLRLAGVKTKTGGLVGNLLARDVIPFIGVSISGQNEKQTKDAARHQSDPLFTENFTFSVDPSSMPSTTVSIVVYDRKGSSNNTIGSVSFPLSQFAVAGGGQTVMNDIPINHDTHPVILYFRTNWKLVTPDTTDLFSSSSSASSTPNPTK